MPTASSSSSLANTAMPLAVSSGPRELPWTAMGISGWWTPALRWSKPTTPMASCWALSAVRAASLGQFNDPMGIFIDQNNRMFVSEQYPWGRVQQFRYITDAEADQLKKEKAAGHQTKQAEANLPAGTAQTAAVSSDAKK